MGTPPKLLIASTMKIFPCFLTILPIFSIGLSMPVVVSEWTTATWVIAPSSFRVASSFSRSGGSNSPLSLKTQLIFNVLAIWTIRSP